MLLLRSLCVRIQIHSRRKFRMTGANWGQGLGIAATGHQGPNIRTHVRRRDIQKLFENYPRASLVDSLMFLEGWDTGAELAYRNPDCDSQ